MNANKINELSLVKLYSAIRSKYVLRGYYRLVYFLLQDLNENLYKEVSVERTD